MDADGIGRLASPPRLRVVLGGFDLGGHLMTLMLRRFWTSLLLLGLAAMPWSCGRTPSRGGEGADAGVESENGADAGPEASMDAGVDAGESIDAGVCGVGAPWLSPDERAKSPRADRRAEILALDASGHLVQLSGPPWVRSTGPLTAPDGVYARVAGELPAIEAAYPWLQNTPALPTFPSTLIFEFDGGTLAAEARDGGYHGWDCLNELYGSTGVSSPLFDRWLAISFGPQLDLAQLVPAYGRLPSVVSVSLDGYIGDSSDICLSVEPEGDVFLYYQGSGDCPSGCIQRDLTGVLVSGDGGLSLLGRWSSADGGRQMPAWVMDREQVCTGRLGRVFPF